MSNQPEKRRISFLVPWKGRKLEFTDVVAAFQQDAIADPHSIRLVQVTPYPLIPETDRYDYEGYVFPLTKEDNNA